MYADPLNDPFDLTGQIALVTGGGRGLGQAFACNLAGVGAAVAVLARSAEQLDQTVSLVTAAGGRALACTADVADRTAVEAAVRRIERDLGPMGLLVNNAGAAGPIGPLAAADPDDWWRCLEVNLRGPLLCTRAVLPGMLARRRGRIINVASGAGTRAIPYLSGYVTGKAALIRLTENLAEEVRGQGVSVFAIQPGMVRTTMAEEALNSEAGRTWLPWLREASERGDDVPPEHAAHLVLLLATGRADALSGRFLDVAWDVAGLARQADEVRAEDRCVLRLRMPR
jgi:NAD(P)-dependent dehydrogenase (short-subunit alcohol dehydrogenase family)